MIKVEGVVPLLRMVHVAPLPRVESPLIVSLKPLRFQLIVPVVKPSMMTLPLPNPLGMTSLAPLAKMLAPVLLLAWMMVVPVQSLAGLASATVPLTVAREPKAKLNGPDIRDCRAPAIPPLPPMVVSPISVHGPVKTQLLDMRIAPRGSPAVPMPAMKTALVTGSAGAVPLGNR